MKINARALTAGLTLLIGCVGAHAAIVLDNTNDRSVAPANVLGSTTQSNWNARVFDTPATGNWTLDLLTMGMYDTGSNTWDILVRLFNVDGSNDPTGSALASQTFSQSFTTTGTYYDFDLTGDDWTLMASARYALVVSSSAPSTTLSWTTPSPAPAYTASEGFAYIVNKRTTNAGSSWSSNTFYNSMVLEATSGSVPAPSVVLLLLPGMAGLLALRRRNTRGKGARLN